MRRWSSPLLEQDEVLQPLEVGLFDDVRPLPDLLDVGIARPRAHVAHERLHAVIAERDPHAEGVDELSRGRGALAVVDRMRVGRQGEVEGVELRPGGICLGVYEFSSGGGEVGVSRGRGA